MAVHTTTVCDLQGVTHKAERPAETHVITLDGARYEIDTCDTDTRALRAMVARWAQKARRVAGPSAPAAPDRRGRKGKKPRRTQADRERSAAIRRWAAGRGLLASDHGRIPATVTAAYIAWEKHGTEPAARPAPAAGGNGKNGKGSAG